MDIRLGPVNRKRRDAGVVEEENPLSVDEPGDDAAREDTEGIIRRAILDGGRAVFPRHQIAALGHPPGTVTSLCRARVPLIADDVLLELGDVDGTAWIVGP